MKNSNVNIHINANQVTKKHKKRTFSKAYKNYVCMRVREYNESVALVAQEEELATPQIYVWLKEYDASNQYDEVVTQPTPTVQPQVNNTDVLIEALVKKIEQLTTNFSQFKSKLANVAS